VVALLGLRRISASRKSSLVDPLDNFNFNIAYSLKLASAAVIFVIISTAAYAALSTSLILSFVWKRICGLNFFGYWPIMHYDMKLSISVPALTPTMPRSWEVEGSFWCFCGGICRQVFERRVGFFSLFYCCFF
jgi:hypothetical protein